MGLYQNRIVVKVGTSTLTNENGKTDLRAFDRLALVLSDTIDEKVYSLAGGAGSRRGTGGIKTKLRAASLATAQGIDTVITNGKKPSAIYDIIEGRKVGTLFTGNNK